MWANKTKSSSSTPTMRTKVPTQSEIGEILTPDNLRIMVGENEDLILIYAGFSLWDNKIKTSTA